MSIGTQTISRLTVLLMLFFAVTVVGFGTVSIDKAEAATYNSQDNAYLTKLSPILTEFSETGEAVSQSAIPLQSTPMENCINEFGFYDGIVGELRQRLNAIKPTQLLEPVHIKSLDAIGDYITGLSIYSSACKEPDFEMKGKLVNKGSEYLINADKQIIEVNDLIANPAFIPAKVASEDAIQAWCLNKWAGNPQMLDHCIQTQTEAQGQLETLLVYHPNGTPGRKVLLDCSSTWTDASGHNFRMIVFCAKNKIDSTQ